MTFTKCFNYSSAVSSAGQVNFAKKLMTVRRTAFVRMEAFVSLRMAQNLFASKLPSSFRFSSSKKNKKLPTPVSIQTCFRCLAGFFGKRCESIQSDITRNEEDHTGLGYTAGFLIALCVFLFIIVAVAVAYFLAARYRRYVHFIHPALFFLLDFCSTGLIPSVTFECVKT